MFFPSVHVNYEDMSNQVQDQDKAMWEELDAFKTNAFKVGDKVRIYYDYCVRDDYIVKIEHDLLYFKTPSIGKHFKQCRMLKKVKPREWWLGQYLQQQVAKLPPFTAVRTEKPSDEYDDNCYNWVHVREVIDE